jgi:dipeptidyl-peptidase-3
VLKQGRQAAGNLLIELQVRKSTADAAGAREFYTKLTKPIPGWEGEIRNIVLQKKLVGLLATINHLRDSQCWN